MKYIRQYSIYQNLDTHFGLLSSFIPDGLTLEIDNKTFQYPAFKEFSIKDNFYQTWNCKNCGACCRRYYLLWDKNIGEKFWNDEKTKNIRINGKETKIYYKEPDLNKKYCVLAEEKDGKIFCTQYQWRPLLSRAPHIFTRRGDKSVSLIKRQYGRNWALGCKATTSKYTPETKKFDIQRLRFIKESIESYSLEHIVDEVIEAVEGEKVGIVWARNGDIGKWI